MLGLVATNDVIIAQYTPNDLELDGRRARAERNLEDVQPGRQPRHDDVHRLVGDEPRRLMTMFQTRIYGYAPKLHYLSPPWFPKIGDAYTVTLFREVRPY